MRGGKLLALSLVLGFLLHAGCHRTGPPEAAQALPATGSARWDQWLDGETEYGTFTRFSAGHILRALSGPADVKVSAGQDALDRKIELFDVRGLSRRQALLKLSKECGLTLQWATAHEPRTFLGVLETESSSYPAGVPEMTHVRGGDPSEYQQLKKDGRVRAEEIRGADLYYAVVEERCVQLGNVHGMFHVTERFRIAGFGGALKARAALLELMRANPALFEGAEPARFEKVWIQAAGDGRFSWGAFTLDVTGKTYSASIEGPAAFWAYHGRFIAEPSGRWKAENLGKQHAGR